MWSHLRGLRFLLRIVAPAASKALVTTPGLPPQKIIGLPCVVFKPPHPSGGELKPHIDQFSPEELFGALARRRPSSLQWLLSEGVQTLVHISGGTRSGQTLVLAPMWPSRLLVLLALVHPEHPHPGMPRPKAGFPGHWRHGGGPTFYPWWDARGNVPWAALDALRLLESGDRGAVLPTCHEHTRSWYGALLDAARTSDGARAVLSSYTVHSEARGLSVVPLSLERDPGAPQLVMWARGFPHGSAATGPSLRLTCHVKTVPRDVCFERISELVRGLKRVRAIVDEDFDVVRQDREPYDGGIVHRDMDMELNLLPHFKCAYADAVDIKATEQALLD